MLGLATPPVDIYPAAWIGQALLAFTLLADDVTPKARWRRWLRGAFRGWVFGTAVNVVVLRFVPHTIAQFTDLPYVVGLLALLLLGMFQGLRWAIAAWLTQKLRERRVPGFLAFGIAVWASTFVPSVFGWTIAGGLSSMTTLVQLADVIGERGVAALLAISSALLAEALVATRAHARRLAAYRAALATLVPLVMIGAGALRMHAIDGQRERAPKARIALVQPSTEARIRWDPRAGDGILHRLTTLTKAAEQRGTDLVVWPEAAYPFMMAATAKTDSVGPWAVLQAGVHGPVLTGALMVTQNGSYNSAVLVHGGHIDAPYHKIHLLAFGESVPFSTTFPALRRAFVRGTGMLPGDHQVAFESGPIRAAVLNCFEDTLPEAGVEAASVNPNLLVNLTNDAWFVGTEESELHLRLATMRAIELRRDFVRAVNLGPTTWVDAAGRVRGRYDALVAGSLPTQPALLEGRTIFARLGDWSGALLLGLLSLATWLGVRTTPRRGTVK